MKDPAESLEKFLVGGAVRDKILGEPAGDKDWVVVGATEKTMEALGFKSVGKDFPVFLHPITGEEYALARRERKVRKGYRGFKVETDPTVTLEEDLARRDLTVNALALSVDEKLIDPFGGVADLKAGKLRHVSSAFVEDPVRVLRVARFAARFAEKGFEISNETEALIRQMVQNGEVDSLVPERVWRELLTALKENHPSLFFRILRRTGALSRVLPEINALFGVSQVHHALYHEQDAGECALLALDASVLITTDTHVRFAVLVHDLGKGITTQPKRLDDGSYEMPGVNPAKALCLRLRVPAAYRELALTVTKHYPLMNELTESSTSIILKLLKALKTFRDPAYLTSFVLACQGASRTRKDNKQISLAAEFLIGCADAARDVDLRDLGTSFPDTQDRGHEANRRRLAAIANVCKEWKRLNDR